MRKLIIGVLIVLVGAVAVPTPSPSDAQDLKSQPFFAVGTIVEVDVSAFTIEVTDSSTSAQPCIDASDTMTVEETPVTEYRKEEPPGSGTYVSASRDEVVVAGDDVRVNGARLTREDGLVTCTARKVWNPPFEPGPAGGATVPNCTDADQPKQGQFNIVGDVRNRRAHVPCTGVGGYPGGFTLENLDGVDSRPEERAVEAYGGESIEIYVTPLTEYFEETSPGSGEYEPSTWGSTLGRDARVETLGFYEHLGGAWTFVAQRVFSPPRGERPDTINVRSDVEAVQTGSNPDGSVNYAGPSNGPNFAFGDFSATLTWTSTMTGFDVSGTWKLERGDNSLEGTLDGSTSGTTLTSTSTVTGGTGFWDGASGSGTFNGSIVPGPSTPSALEGTMKVTVSR